MICIDFRELWLMPKCDDRKGEKRRHMCMRKLIHTAPDGKFALPVCYSGKNLGFTF